MKGLAWTGKRTVFQTNAETTVDDCRVPDDCASKPYSSEPVSTAQLKKLSRKILAKVDYTFIMYTCSPISVQEHSATS